MRLARTIVIGVAAAMVLSACAGGGDGGTPTDPTEPDTSNLPAGVSIRAEDQAFVLERNAPVTGGTLRIAQEAPAESLDPARAEGSGTRQVQMAIFDELFRWDFNGEVAPHMAESIETDDDGKTWVLKLRPGIKFTDGTDLNAEAVAAHWTRIGAEGSTSRAAADVRNIESMVATNATTLTLVLKEASLTFPKVIVSNPGHMNWIQSPAAVAQWGDQGGFHAVGAGPFMVKSFTSGGDSVLERNPNYWRDGLPYLDELHFVLATDTQSRLAAAVAGDLDLAMSQMGTDLKSAEDQGLVSLYQPTWTYFNFLFNLSKPPFDDVRFREAVMRGIDLDGVNAAVFDGTHEVMRGLLTEGNPFFIDTDWPSYDPDKAKELIEEWQADTGLAPEFDMTTTSPPEFQKQVAVIQQMLDDVGITMNIAVGDQPTMISEGRSGNYTAQHRFIGVTPEVDQVLYSNFFSTSAGNNGHAGNPELDQLLLDARAATSTDERRDLYEQMQEVLREWLPMMPLIQHRNGWYAGEKVGGFPGVLPTQTGPDVALLYIAE